MALFQTLDITHISAHNLKRPSRFATMHVYAVVSISDRGGQARKQEVKTLVDRGGDANPRWDDEIQFNLDQAALQADRLILTFKLLWERSSGDEAVAELTVPVNELLRNPAAAAGRDHSVARDLRKPGGKPKGGRLNFSCKFGRKPPPAEGNSMVAKAIGFGFGIGKAVVGAVASEVMRLVEPGPSPAEPDPVGRGRGLNPVKPKPKANTPRRRR